MELDTEYFLTAPTERILIRRGDPLGFRAAAECFADILAPDLTNRTHDARWLSLLSWIMVRVEEARRQLHFGHVETGFARQRAIYEWIRPLEIMWIVRAVRTFPDRKLLDRRQLPGRNVLLRSNGKGERFGMSGEQFLRYRFMGPHGAYRSLLGRLSRMTLDNDGHTPGPEAHRLARFVNEKIPDVKHPQMRKGRKPVPIAYWERAWPGRFGRLEKLERWLPGRSDGKPNLFAKERKLIERLLFVGRGNPERRRSTAEAAARSKARDHAELCRDVVRTLNPLSCDEKTWLGLLYAFTQFADSGVDAMDQVWRVTKEASDGPAVQIKDLAADRRLRQAVDDLVRTGEAWQKVAKNKIPGSPLLEPVHLLASEVTGKTSYGDRLEALVLHHRSRGGGRRWFQLREGKVIPDAPTDREGTTRYRFRLWSLARLAWQTGVTNGMPPALGDQLDDEESERAGE